MQWSIGREYNRRLKVAFDTHGIEMPFPHQTIYFGEDKSGTAPTAFVALQHDDKTAPASSAAAQPTAKPKATPTMRAKTASAGGDEGGDGEGL